jgi:hypothetical protein
MCVVTVLNDELGVVDDEQNKREGGSEKEIELEDSESLNVSKQGTCAQRPPE